MSGRITTTDHAHFQGRSEAVLAVTIIMIVLCSVFVFFRMLSRIVIVKKVSYDDYFMLVAWTLALGMSIAICVGASYGLGRHETDIPQNWQSTLSRSNYAFSVLYQPALMATKTSILAFYLTFSTANHIFRWACYATLFVVNAGGFALTMVTVFQCIPVQAVFDLVQPANAACTDILTIYLSSIPLNIITDLALLFLPIPILTGMRLPKKQKIILLVTFSFGIFVAIVDVVRISYLQSASTLRLTEIQAASSASSTRTAEATDSSYYLAYSFMWSAIEVAVGIMCACVPGLKPLVARFLPNLLRSASDTPSQLGSLSLPAEAQKPAPPLHDDVQPVHHKDFGRGPDPEDDEAIGFLEFLTGRRGDTEPSGKAQDESAEMGMLDFLTTPEMAHTGLERSPTALTNTSRHTGPESGHFFDFVNMKEKKSLVHLSNRESVYPVAIVTVLFFIWGFEYGLLNTLNAQFQTAANVSTSQALGIRSAYYIGYFAGPLAVGGPALKHWGFRACFPLGLSIYAAGALIFWPAAVLTSWPTFLVTNFIVGFGLSVLEVSANPFIVICGPARYAEVRLNISQGVQAIGSIIAPLIASKSFVRETSHAPSLINTQWAYLGIALATVILALVYYYVPIPEATDAELEDAAERLDGANKARLGNVPILWLVLGLGVLSQFCYVGGQEVIGTTFIPLLDIIAPGYNSVDYLAIAHTMFAVSRFLFAGLGIWIKPRILLLISYTGLIIFTSLSTHYQGQAGVAVLMMVFFFEGPLFALIFAQAIRGQGRNTKFASVLLTAAISGGALFSPIARTVAESGQGTRYSLVVAVAAYAAGAVFAIGLNVHPLAGKLVDPVAPTSHDNTTRPSSTSSRASKALSFLSMGKKPRQDSHGGAEHQERKQVTFDDNELRMLQKEFNT